MGMHIHTSPLQHPEQTPIHRPPDIHTYDVRPERYNVLRSDRSLIPRTQLLLINITEEHEHSRDDIGRRCNRKWRRILVRSLREETERDVFMLEEVWEPLPVIFGVESA